MKKGLPMKRYVVRRLLMAIPLVFAVVALLGVSVQNVIIANVFIKWAWYARMIRTGVMQYRDRNFVQFSRCVGMPERFILFRHLLPSSLPTWWFWLRWMWAGRSSIFPRCLFWDWAYRPPRRNGAQCSMRQKM